MYNTEKNLKIQFNNSTHHRVIYILLFINGGHLMFKIGLTGLLITLKVYNIFQQKFMQSLLTL